MTSMAFDGEAPETDDEIEDEEEKPVEKRVESKDLEQKQIPVDKNLKKRWTQVAVETIQSCQKRSVNQEKTMQKVIDLAAESFTSMQNVTSRLNVIQTNVTRLEDSVADLVDASKMFPNEFPVLDLDIPVFL